MHVSGRLFRDINPFSESLDHQSYLIEIGPILLAVCIDSRDVFPTSSDLPFPSLSPPNAEIVTMHLQPRRMQTPQDVCTPLLNLAPEAHTAIVSPVLRLESLDAVDSRSATCNGCR